MRKEDLDTYCEKTWCPGCGNFGIESALKEAVVDLVNEEGYELRQFVFLAGIGCHGKILDYLKTNSFYSLHGRVLPPATGIKIAYPNSVVIGSAGDGDAYGEGIAHLIFVAKRNVDMTLLVHNNRIYALTTGQFTPTSPQGFPGRSTPQGSPEKPLNPLELVLVSGATFVARGYAAKKDHLKNLIKEAVKHKGFSFIDILQPCFTYFNTYEIYSQKVYEIGQDHDVTDFEKALSLAREWDYDEIEENTKIPIGIFYKVDRPTFNEEILKGRDLRKEEIVESLKEILEKEK